MSDYRDIRISIIGAGELFLILIHIRIQSQVC